MSDLMSELTPELTLDRDAIELARRSALAVASHRPEDFEGMRKAGRLAAEVLDLLVPEVKAGVTTEALDKIAFDYVLAHGALPARLGYRGYRHTLHLDQSCRLSRHSQRPATKGRRHSQHRRDRHRGWVAWRYQPHVLRGRGQPQSPEA